MIGKAKTELFYYLFEIVSLFGIALFWLEEGDNAEEAGQIT